MGPGALTAARHVEQPHPAHVSGQVKQGCGGRIGDRLARIRIVEIGDTVITSRRASHPSTVAALPRAYAPPQSAGGEHPHPAGQSQGSPVRFPVSRCAAHGTRGKVRYG